MLLRDVTHHHRYAAALLQILTREIQPNSARYARERFISQSRSKRQFPPHSSPRNAIFFAAASMIFGADGQRIVADFVVKRLAEMKSQRFRAPTSIAAIG